MDFLILICVFSLKFQNHLILIGCGTTFPQLDEHLRPDGVHTGRGPGTLVAGGTIQILMLLLETKETRLHLLYQLDCLVALLATRLCAIGILQNWIHLLGHSFVTGARIIVGYSIVYFLIFVFVRKVFINID